MKKRRLNLFCAGGLLFGSFLAVSWSDDRACTSAEDRGCCAADVSGGDTAAVTLSLPIRGWTSDSDTEFTKSLRSIGRDLFECAGHADATQAEPGTCAACGGAELAKRHVSAFTSMQLAVSGLTQTCRAELRAGETVLLSDITRALTDCNMSVDFDRLRLGPKAQLHLGGLNCAGCEGKVTTALEQLKGVSSASCSWGTGTESLGSMILANAVGIEYEDVQAAVTKAGFSLADVSWTGAGTVRPEPEYELGITGFAKRLGARSELLIHGLIPAGAAERAGLEAGDRIITINGGVAFEFTREELAELMSAPDPVVFEIERGEEAFRVEVTPLALGSSGAEQARAEESPTARSVREKPARGLFVGEAAPAIVGEDLDGIPFELADYRGKVTVVSFWGFW